MPLHYIGERTVHHVGNFKDSVVLRIADTRHPDHLDFDPWRAGKFTPETGWVPDRLGGELHLNASHSFLAKTNAFGCVSVSMAEAISSSISASIFSFKVFADFLRPTTSCLNRSTSCRDKTITSYVASAS